MFGMSRVLRVGLVIVFPLGGSLGAQQQDTVKKATDTTRVPVPKASSAKPAAVAPITGASFQRSRFTPPLTPKRAFAYSAILPGYGQSRLDRGTSGALFASVELAAFVMMRRTGLDLREARRYQIDTLPDQYVVSGQTTTKSGTFTNRYTADLVRARQLHVEDWIATIAFNHLFAGADAFVAAQLWDVPVQLTAAPGPSGIWFIASVPFR